VPSTTTNAKSRRSRIRLLVSKMLLPYRSYRATGKGPNRRHNPHDAGTTIGSWFGIP
jgi:hypothetical protein